MQRISTRLFAAACLINALPLSALAQDFPSKPITFVVPFTAGSATDQLGRAIAIGPRHCNWAAPLDRASQSRQVNPLSWKTVRAPAP